MSPRANMTQEDIISGVEERINVPQRSYDDTKEIVRPRNREITRKLDRLELVRRKIEVFFGSTVTAVFTDGSNNTVNHEFVDLEVPHVLGRVPLDVIPGLGAVKTAAEGGGPFPLPVRRGIKKWTDKNIYLRANVAGTVRLYLVVD